MVVFAEMAGMGQAGNGIPADEVAPGRYVAKEVPLGMTGDWRLSVRISPKGQATQIVRVALSSVSCERRHADRVSNRLGLDGTRSR